MKYLWIVFMMAMLAAPAAAQIPMDEAAVPMDAAAEPPWLPLVLSLLGAVAGSGFLSTFISSDRWWMKIIDVLAFNWGKARNDPNSQ